MPEVSKFEYLEDLILRRLKLGNGSLFYVDQDYRVQFDLDGKLTNYIVPKGLETDLASIPSIVPAWITDKVDSHLEAAVVHDSIYRTKPHPFPREVADAIFLEGMLSAGVPLWKRQAMYRAVRTFGGAHWA